MRLGYNTNGLAHHRLTDAIDLLADQGYQSVRHHPRRRRTRPYEEPDAPGPAGRAVRAAPRRPRAGPGGRDGRRYLLNPWLKHDPTLMDPDPARREIRIDFFCRAIDLATSTWGRGVSLWSGKLSEPDRRGRGAGPAGRGASGRCIAACREAGTFRWPSSPSRACSSTRSTRFARLDERIDHPLFDLTLDLGHVHCIDEGPVAGTVRGGGRGSATSTSRTWSGASTST